MNLLYSEDHRLLADSAREFLAARSPVSRQRALRDEGSELGFDNQLWQEAVALGWSAIPFPENLGGLDFGCMGLGPIFESIGSNLSASPLLSSVVLCGSLLHLQGNAQQQDRWLSATISGEQRLALALDERPRHSPAQLAVQVVANAQGFCLNGQKTFVIDGVGADGYLVVAGNAQQGVSLFLVPADAPGLSVEPLSLIDSRNHAHLQLDQVQVGPDALLGDPGSASAALTIALDRGRVCLAAEMLGMAEKLFALTLDYLKTRVQFDVAIGSFQSLQHRSAQLYVELALARSAVMAGLAALDDTDLSEVERQRLVSLAKWKAGLMAVKVANEAVQMHGGIGVTDELDVGLFLKRIRVAQACLGMPNITASAMAHSLKPVGIGSSQENNKMKLEQWQSAWDQLIGPGSPYEVLTPVAGGPKHFRHSAPNLWAAMDAGRAHADREFLVWEQQRLTFRQFFDQVDRLAGQLVHRFGVRKGDRVAIAMRNQPAWLVAFAAIQRCAGVCVPLNSWGLRDELFHGLQDSGTQLLLCDEPRLQLLKDDLREQGLATVVVGMDANQPRDEHCQRLEDLLAEPLQDAPVPTISADDPAMILYTSGTTSLAKGVLSTHGAVCQALVALEFQGVFCAVSSPERISVVINSGYAPTTLMAVPLFHVSGLHAQFLLALRGGRRLVLMYKWDVEKAFDLIRDEHCTQFNGAPVMMQQLLTSPRFGSADTQSLFGLGLGGAAPSASLLAHLTQRKPEAVGGSGYGLTESNGICAAIGGDQFVYKPASAGWPLPIVDVRIGESPQRALPAGVSGLIWVRSPTLMNAYWNLPEASAQTLNDGWLDTGDIGHLDEEGFLYITDRAKDLINRGGEKISAAEIESCACEMPGVIEAAAFAVPDDVLGEVVFVVVRGNPDDCPDREAVRGYFAQRLASYKVPAQIHVQHTPFARNASGKMLKGLLKEVLVTA